MSGRALCDKGTPMETVFVARHQEDHQNIQILPHYYAHLRSKASDNLFCL